MPTERSQHNVMMAFALCPVTRLLYLQSPNNTAELRLLFNLSVKSWAASHRKDHWKIHYCVYYMGCWTRDLTRKWTRKHRTKLENYLCIWYLVLCILSLPDLRHYTSKVSKTCTSHRHKTLHINCVQTRQPYTFRRHRGHIIISVWAQIQYINTEKESLVTWGISHQPKISTSTTLQLVVVATKIQTWMFLQRHFTLMFRQQHSLCQI